MQKRNPNKNRIGKLPIANCQLLDSRGVTLLELMVSVTLFAITILMSTQIFQTVLEGQRQAVASQDMQESIRYVFERAGKELRNALKDETGSCNAAPGKIYRVVGGTEIIFRNYKGQCMRYFLNNKRLAVQRGIEPMQYITPSNITITKAFFQVTDNSETVQAKVLMRLQMEISVKSQSTQKLNIQTVVSSRFYE
jgi:prepilin-type N-terminal cleavage/methylation domain-containing protein